MWAELDAEDQTLLVNIRRSPGRFEVPLPLPVMDEPALYIVHPDVMQINTRKNYVRDRMQAALIYISEYEETKHMMTEGQYNNDDLLVRLRAVFGRVDQVRHHIDVALQQDDAHRRKRNMGFLMLPMRFPRPESMESIRNLHMQQRQNRRSTQEQNKNTPSAPQTPRIEVNQEEANLIQLSPVVEQQVPSVQGATGFQEQPK